MRTLNLGILAHVDAGKTSLTERLLFDAGVIPKLGSVDEGNTQTDSLELERQRGITIKSAVVAFMIGRTNVNLVDTPGHPDFIAEVERALAVLDAAIVVVSAVEGVQAQTRILVRTLRRMRVPFFFFVNKIDRRGADYEAVLGAIATLPNVRPLAMSVVEQEGMRGAVSVPDNVLAGRARHMLIDVLAETDESLLKAFVNSPEQITDGLLHRHLVEQVAQGIVQPTYAGSAKVGAGVAELMAAIEHLLPAREPDDDSPVGGRIFKIDRGWGGEKLVYLSLTSGMIRVRDLVNLPKGQERVTGIEAFVAGRLETVAALRAGQVGRVHGLSSATVGDTLGLVSGCDPVCLFAPPTLETCVVARRPGERQSLWAALSQLSEQDPLINLRHDKEREQIFISLYGEVQKEVIADTLEQQFGLGATFLESTVICVERVVGSGGALEIASENGNPFVATVGLRIEPKPPGTGNEFRFAVNNGLMPAGFYRAVEIAAMDALKRGLRGWAVIDCLVTMTAAGQVAPISAAADFRQLTPLVLATAISKAGTVVCEPISRFRIETPPPTMGAVVGLLSGNGAAIAATELGAAAAVLTGMIRTARVQHVQKELPDITAGNATIAFEFDRYVQMSNPSSRSTSGPDPFDREGYFASFRR